MGRRPLIWQNAVLEQITPEEGRLGRGVLENIEQALGQHGTLSMRSLSSGLFPAAAIESLPAASGYRHVWVRDNVYVAYAHLVRGQTEVASRAMRAVFDFFWKSRHRFEAVIEHGVKAENVMARPHIRFDGETGEELPERWSHAQNDALGYALWLFARLAASGAIAIDDRWGSLLTFFPRYFGAIRYWQDEDSGHWEEVRRRSASSIGTVVAGLGALLALARGQADALRAAGFGSRFVDLTADLLLRGHAALGEILPGECVQLSPQQNRRYDAALLFLIHPLGVVGSPRAELILSDIQRFLTSDHGIRRYLGDSYWAPDYDAVLSPEEQTSDYSENMAARDVLLDRIGHEAEWCIFDPILSAHYGARYRDTSSAHDLALQEHHLRRSLAQITPSWRCPELYYRKNGKYVANPHTPLLWTQANLVVALSAMRESVARTHRS